MDKEINKIIKEVFDENYALSEIEFLLLKKENYLNVKLSLINDNLFCDIFIDYTKREIVVRYGTKFCYSAKKIRNPYAHIKKMEFSENDDDIFEFLTFEEASKVKSLIFEELEVKDEDL